MEPPGRDAAPSLREVDAAQLVPARHQRILRHRLDLPGHARLGPERDTREAGPRRLALGVARAGPERGAVALEERHLEAAEPRAVALRRARDADAGRAERHGRDEVVD